MFRSKSGGSTCPIVDWEVLEEPEEKCSQLQISTESGRLYLYWELAPALRNIRELIAVETDRSVIERNAEKASKAGCLSVEGPKAIGPLFEMHGFAGNLVFQGVWKCNRRASGFRVHTSLRITESGKYPEP